MSTWHRVAGALKGVRLLQVHCDGSGEARVGQPGGWAFVVVRDDQVLAEGSGRAAVTTSLVMELKAALHGLRAVVAHGWHRDHLVELISDSSIALEVAAGKFVPKTQAALAHDLREAAIAADARTRWVRGHSGVSWNERVDAAAEAAKKKKKGKPSPRPSPPKGRGR